MNLIRRTKTNVDRRRTLRKAPEKFAFIQLDRDDGGAVLNVSEGGLSFNTFAPVDQKGPIHFWFSLNLSERIDAWGEVAWTDDTQKVGGLRFIRLPQRAERQIREWISTTRQVPDDRFAPRSVAGLPSRVSANEPDATANFVSKARSKRATMRSDREEFEVPNAAFPPIEEPEASARVVPKARTQRSPILPNKILSSSEGSIGSGDTLPLPAERTVTGELVPIERYRSAKRRQLIVGLLLGASISATVAVSAFLYSNYHRASKGPITVSRAMVTQESDVQASPSLTAPTPSRPSADVFSGSSQIKGASARTPSVLASENGGHPSPHPGEPLFSNPSARVPLQSSLSGTANRQKPVMTRQQLWASVQAGNTNSAVALAELYIKGEGVPQNCDQARVLLLMASEKRNAAAIKRLAELDKTGCP